MAMWQHTFGVYAWRSVWRCKLDSKSNLKSKLKCTVKQFKIHYVSVKHNTYLNFNTATCFGLR